VTSESPRSKASICSRQSRNARYSQIVNQIENLVFSRIGESFRISDLCKAAGACERTIRAAFHELYETTPHRFVHMLRMREARKALVSPEYVSATVTQIATHFGFLELGRFSVEYRLIFGECPSVTKHRTAAAVQINSTIHAHQAYSSLPMNGRSCSLPRRREKHSGRDMPSYLSELEATPAILNGYQSRALLSTCTR